MNEIIFVVEDSPEGGYSAKAAGESVFTEAETLAELQRKRGCVGLALPQVQ